MVVEIIAGVLGTAFYELELQKIGITLFSFVISLGHIYWTWRFVKQIISIEKVCFLCEFP